MSSPADPAFAAALARLLAGERDWLAAVSGGADSTYLLEQAAKSARHEGTRLAALHLNHGLRGRDADEDERQARRQAFRLGLPLRVVDCRWCRPPRGNVQATARRLRRAQLLAARAEGGVILLGHQADDQGESTLAALAKGKSPLAARGMCGREGVWLRPLLEHPAAWIRARCRALGLAWREDASNHDGSYERGHLRHVWLSPLRTGGAEADLLLARMGGHLGALHREIEQAAEELIACLDLRPSEVGWSLERRPFLRYHEPVALAALRLLGKRLGMWSRDPARAWMESWLRFMREGRPGARMSINGEWMAEATRGRVRLLRQSIRVEPWA
jgi:tRNA(Ile)-lysidine synthetase-like protein